MGVAVAGGAAGYGLADLLAAKTNLFRPTQENFARRATAAKVIIPILSSAAVLLADRYRNKLNQEYKKVPGYEGSK